MKYTTLVVVMTIVILGILFIVDPIYRARNSSKDVTLQLIQESELSVTNTAAGTTSTIDYIVEFNYKGHTYLKFGNGDNITHAGHCPACKQP